jgi:hypothetical protein
MLAVAIDELDEHRPELKVITGGIPPFPWGNLRQLLVQNGYFSGDTRHQPVAMTKHRLFEGVRPQSIHHPERAAAVTAVARAFFENHHKHNLWRVHLKVFMACELGMVPKPDAKGIYRWCLYRPERPDAVMPYDEAAREFGIRADLVKYYHDMGRRAVEDEWKNIHSWG